MGKKEKNALLFTTYQFLSLSLSRSLFECILFVVTRSITGPSLSPLYIATFEEENAEQDTLTPVEPLSLPSLSLPLVFLLLSFPPCAFRQPQAPKHVSRLPSRPPRSHQPQHSSPELLLLPPRRPLLQLLNRQRRTLLLLLLLLLFGPWTFRRDS